jgi:ribosomal RNA-processing protein 8
MFCGTGKSLLMRKCSITTNKSLVVYVFPSLPLIDQFYSDYLSDVPSEDILKISSELEATTDPVKIVHFLSKQTNKIICVTYHSYGTLLENLGGVKIDVCMFDEAHHAVGDTYKKLIFENDLCEKQLFFTATPKNENGIVMYDREDLDAGMCGKLVYDYSYLKGVNEGYLNPVEIRVDTYTENTNKSVYDSIARAILTSGNNRVLTFHSHVTTDGDTSVNNFVNDAEFKRTFKEIQKNEFPDNKKYKKIKMIGITSSTKQRRKILDEFDTTPDNEIVVISSCETIGEGIDTKNANMSVFVDPKSSYVKIIQNIGRIVRKVFGVDKPNSTILIPCWVDKTKYAECDGDREKCDAVIRADMSADGNFNGILNVLSALKQEDEELYDICLNYPSSYSSQEIRSNLQKQGFNILDPVGDGSLLDNIGFVLDTEIDYDEYEDCDTDEELIMRIAEDNDVCVEIHTTSLETPIEVYNADCEGGDIVRLYRNDDDDEDYDDDDDVIGIQYQPIVKNSGEKKSKNKLSAPNRGNRLRVNVHANPDVQVLWNITCDFDITKDICSCVIDCQVSWNIKKWQETHTNLKAYMDTNKKTPRQADKDTLIKSMGYWLCDQKKNYKNKTKIMKNPDIQKEWEDTLEAYKHYLCIDEIEIWRTNHTNLKAYMDTNKKTPIKESKDQVIKSMGIWLSYQKRSYKNNKRGSIMADPDIRKEWEDTLAKYKQYLCIDNVGTWRANLANLKVYIDTNKKAPSTHDTNTDVKTMGCWLGNQKKIYNKNKGIMANPVIRKEWKDILKTYNEYLCDNVELWRTRLANLKAYMDTNKTAPSKTDKNKDVKFMGIWVGTQKTNYKTKKDIMKNPDILKEWENTLDKYKEYLCIDDIQTWRTRLANLKAYMDTNKTAPSQTDQNKDVKFLATWISHQKESYKNKTKIMKNPDILKEWENTLDKYKEYLCIDDIKTWRTKHADLKTYMDTNKKAPSTTDKDLVIKSMGKWVSHQKENYKNKTGIMKNPDIQKEWEDTLVSDKYKQYLCIDNIGVWRANLANLNAYMDTNKKNPSDKDKNKEIKYLGKWVSHQKPNYKNKTGIMKNPAIRKEWEDTLKKYGQYLKQDICEILTDDTIITTASNPDTSAPKPKKTMKLKVQAIRDPVETAEHKRTRVKTELSTLHQRYKTMNSQNLGKEFAENPETWTKYHEISEENEKSFPEDGIPRNRIIRELDKIKTKREKIVVDMGCGKAQIAQHYVNDRRFQFINYDHISSNETVTSCDISHTPLEDDSVEICILSLAMWGSNCREYIQEASRILESNGRLYIIEPTKRWSEQDERGNIIPGQEGTKMKTLLEENGFHVLEQEVEKFCVFTCLAK